ncbi:hypothetical protein [Tamlana sp. I1]|uniref:hypothetical protein n=1 Tax=Tamlana sp. I1 TaxID=2762061 RepID=UPI00188E943E|nr:hypothetical protein [Tamlana sp. I1]
MSKIKVFMPCNEAGHICDKAQYEEATLWDKIKLKMHVLYCKGCRKHTKINTKLTEIIKVSNVECLDKKCKEAMKKTLEQALNENKHQN